ncbi:MAG: hypothetical protein RLZZ400_1022 [Actinomycetota bacterium]
MTQSSRPRIALLGRLAEHTSATRREGLVTARMLAEAVWQAGGEPLTMLPVADSDWASRMDGIDGVLMPGGADLNPRLYGQEPESDELYGIDDLQDSADLSLTKWALEQKLPFLAICRGLQVVNVAYGGTLVQHMEQDHRHVISEIKMDSDVDRLGLSSNVLRSSCYHHQAIDRLGDGLRVIARADLGHVEAFAIDNGAWSYAVQWHPEDNAAQDAQQAELFARFIDECRK